MAGDLLAPDEFFDLVDELVTPAMAGVGVVRQAAMTRTRRRPEGLVVLLLSEIGLGKF